ncbi:hypothetical protein AJ79_06314 [Helicocarpus griseus UAMH5409]|uniref:Extracellular membrane protein CFEM domain-containing protein n=1 Tax=Helicocarpus griseus UAMH5409 TaxID=1447875 RepID=A0A2B7XE71_9EURO|nr:hypothetical protein AJ79_06314 [Helicocarpus griseus UAMH5409]
MKSFTIFALAGLLASASALPQETKAPTPSLSPEAKCAAEQCSVEDICCKAKCYNVPCPSEGMANETTECAMKCPQGSGTPQDTINYAKCQTDCINSHFFKGSSVIPQPTETGNAPSKTGDATGTGAAATGSAATASGSPTGSEESSTPSPSTGAAAISNAQLGSSAAGIVGLLMAALAL